MQIIMLLSSRNYSQAKSISRHGIGSCNERSSMCSAYFSDSKVLLGPSSARR